MRKSVIISLIVASVLSISGCDWIRGELGMPTSADLDAYRSSKYVSKVDTSVIPAADSTSADSLSKQANALPAADCETFCVKWLLDCCREVSRIIKCKMEDIEIPRYATLLAKINGLQGDTEDLTLSGSRQSDEGPG